MIKTRGKNRLWICIVTVIALVLPMTGCSGSKLSKAFAPRQTVKSKKSASMYYDFGDVLIPTELKKDKGSSFIYKTRGFAGGVLSLKGRVEMNSLTNFFSSNMARDNWRLISYFKSPRTIMLFHKENRWCVISISEGDFSTRAEIWVAPTIDDEAEPREVEGLLK
ncbi:hypothetical protein QUF80_04745 [Desulfococcaceae bacterium HSG8]|nr:hypothetical protein [Desulfococcaceae bacterium HSG8]